MSIADKYRPKFTWNDYLQWEGRWELIEGMPYAMSPAPAPQHQIVNGNLQTIFTDALRRDCGHCRAYLPIDWKISEETVVQPDLLVACKKINKTFLDFIPELTLEILSPSTAFKDRHEKFELYGQQGVPYYVIVDPAFQLIEVYQLTEKKYGMVSTNLAEFTFVLNSCTTSIDFTPAWQY